nr:MAG TPA: hypothetical protein [Caudoviricetes sp.]
MMLLFNEVKKDIKEGYDYVDYDSKTYKGYNVHTILDKEEVLYYITDEGRQVTVHFERNYFLRLKYGTLANIVMTHIYYNMVDKLED